MAVMAHMFCSFAIYYMAIYFKYYIKFMKEYETVRKVMERLWSESKYGQVRSLMERKAEMIRRNHVNSHVIITIDLTFLKSYAFCIHDMIFHSFFLWFFPTLKGQKPTLKIQHPKNTYISWASVGQNFFSQVSMCEFPFETRPSQSNILWHL